MRSTYLVYFIIFVIFTACSQSTENSKDMICGTYSLSLYSGDTIITSGYISIIKSDSSDSIKTDGFINLFDSIGVAQYIPDSLFKCDIKNDSLELITASQPDWSLFIIKGYYSDNSIKGNWQLWGHLALDQTGLLTGKKN